MPRTTDLSSISDTYWSGLNEDGDDGEGDLMSRFFGRENEISLLHEIFDQVCCTKDAATVVIHGESGVGKTSLVNTLRLRVHESGGCLCSGKFFQNSELQEPFSAIMAAFSDVCDVVVQSTDFNDERRNEIQRKLGDTGYLLTKAVSSITAFLEDDASLSEEAVDLVVNERSLSKFNIACKTFMQAMSSDEHPLVIFFDDIQWSDVGSQQLIERFINDKEVKNVLLILAYRDEEADAVRPLFNNDPVLVDIPLESLDSAAIYEMVCRANGGESSERMQELSDLVEQRSEGNPFHVQTFLDMIKRENLMVFDPEKRTWVFDVDVIRTSVMMNSSLAEALSRKIELESHHSKQTLKIAAMIGYQFSDLLLVEVLSTLQLSTPPSSQEGHHELANSTSVEECLSRAMEIGFVEKIKTGFQFTHDKILTAFRELTRDEEEWKRIHGIIGSTILSVGDEDDNAIMHHAALHLNAASIDLTSDQDRHRLVKVNLRASKYCANKAAYAAAGELLKKGLSLMSPCQRWSELYFDVAFEMTELLARTELVTGNFEGCKEATREALHHAKCTEMKINLLLLDVEARRTSNYNLNEMIDCARRALHEVGVQLPKRVTKRRALVKFMNVRRMMRKKTDNEMLGLPMMHDKLAETAIKILSRVCISCMVQEETNMALYAALRAMQLTLTHGLSEGSPLSLVIYSVVELAVGNQNQAYRHAKLALQVNEITEHQDSADPVGVAASVITWRKEPLVDIRNQLRVTAELSFENGAVWGATFCSVQAFNMTAMLGGNLRNLEDSLRCFCERLRGLGRQDAMLLWVKPLFQFVLNLQRHYADWREAWTLTGEVMNEDHFFHEVENASQRATALSLKCYTAGYFRCFKESTDFSDKLDANGRSMGLSYGRISLLYRLSFAHFELYRASGKRRHLGKARRYRKHLAKLASDGSSDAAMYLLFASAVELTSKKKVGKQQLLDSFENAISKVAEKGNYLLEGTLNEQAAFDLARRGHLSEAHRFFARALVVFRDLWCSNAKYQWLLEKTVIFTEKNKKPWSPAAQIGNVIVCNNKGT